MDGAVELKAPVKVGTVSNPRIFPALAGLLAALWRGPPPVELASLTNNPRVLVTPFGRTSRIVELGGWTELMLILGILTYPGLMAGRFSFGGGVWPRLVGEGSSSDTAA